MADAGDLRRTQQRFFARSIDVSDATKAGQCKRRHVVHCGYLSQISKQLVTIHFRHHHVKNNQVWFFAARRGQGLLSIVSDHYSISFLGQVAFNECDQPLFIVHDHDGF